jgi:hypothetical protein
MWIMVLSPNTCMNLTNFHPLFPFVLFQLDNVSAYLVIKQIYYHCHIPVVSEYYHCLPRSVNLANV